MKNTELLNTALQLNNSPEIERLIKQFLLSNTLQSNNKFNPFDFTAKKDWRLVLTGVHYEDGYMYASDSHLAIKVKQDYLPELEEKTIDKKGAEITEKYPDVNRVIPPDEAMTFVQIDFAKVLEVEKVYRLDCKADKEIKIGLVKVGETYLSVELLAKIAKFALHFGIEKIGIQSPDRCVKITNGESMAILMPVIYTDQKVYEL